MNEEGFVSTDPQHVIKNMKHSSSKIIADLMEENSIYLTAISNLKQENEGLKKELNDLRKEEIEKMDEEAEKDKKKNANKK